MGEFLPFTLRGLGGLNEDEDPTSLRQIDLTEAINTYRLGELTGTRPGLAYDINGEYTEAIASGAPVQGFVEWARKQDSISEFVCVCGGEARKDSGGAVLDKTTNSVVITSGADNLWSFADHNNILYAAGGALGDSFWFWDGTNPLDKIDVQNSVATTLKPKYVFQWKNYMFLCGMDGEVPDDNPLLWRFHELGTDPKVAGNWHISNTIGGGIGGMGAYGSEFSTGTASFQDNNGEFLLCLTNKRIYSYTLSPTSLIGFVENDTIANGCVSQHAFVDLGMDSGDAIYLSRVGIHSLRLSQQYSGKARSFLSWPIRRTFADLNQSRLDKIVSGYWPTEGLVAFACSTGSNSAHNLILAMDIQNAEEITPDTVRWYKWYLDTSVKITSMSFARDSSNRPKLFIGGHAGQIGMFSRDAYSDFGESYPGNFTTKHEDFGRIDAQKTVGDCDLLVRGTGTDLPIHTYIFDYAEATGPVDSIPLPTAGAVYDTAIFDTDVFASGIETSRAKIWGEGSATTVAHDFTFTGTNSPFFVSAITQEIAGTGESVLGEDAA